MGISDPPGIYKPEEPIKMSMEGHKYLKWYSPAFSRGKPTEEAVLANDTVINYLNEIMKFLPRGFTDALTNHEENKDTLSDATDKKDWADSIYNKELQQLQDGLWVGNQSTVQSKIFGDTISLSDTDANAVVDSGKFTGLGGVPFDGSTSIGTWDNKQLFTKEKRNDADTAWEGVLAYQNKYNDSITYELNDSVLPDYGKVVPIISSLKGETYSKGFSQGVNFHPGIVDMQHTLGSFDNSVNNFLVDMDGDGFADNDINKNGIIDASEDKTMSLSNTAINTSYYTDEYLSELGINMPIVDYSSTYTDFMNGSLFSADNLQDVYVTGSESFSYNSLQHEIESNMNGDFSAFVTKLQSKFSDIGGTGLDYMPNIYEIARKGIDLTEKVNGVDVWTDKDIFYMSMLMLESRRRYTYSMSTVFNVKDNNLDIAEWLNTYSNPDMWKYDEKEKLLYIDVKTKTASSKMYNYFIPDDVGEDIPDTEPDYERKRIIAKCNWLKRRGIELEAYNTALESYQKNLQKSLEKYVPMITADSSQYKNLKNQVYNKVGDESKTALDDHFSLLDEMSAYLKTGKMDNYLASYYIESVDETKKRLAWEIYQKAVGLGEDPTKYFENVSQKDIADYDTFATIADMQVSKTYKVRENDDIDNIRLLYSLIETHTNMVLQDANDVFLNPLFNSTGSPVDRMDNALANPCYDLNLDEMGDYGLESKEMIVSRVRNSLAQLAQQHRADIYSAKDGYSKIIGESYNPTNMLSVLSNLAEKSSRLFNDIQQVNDFNKTNYGNVNYVVDSSLDMQNLAQYGISNMGYYPERVAKSSFNSPYLSKTYRPLNLEGDDLISGSLSVDSNPLDKVYWDMINEMQKTSTFFMMQSFASPTNGHLDAAGNWQLDSGVTDLNNDGTIDYKDLSLNFTNPLESVYRQLILSPEDKRFSSSEMLSVLNSASTKVSNEYINTQLTGITPSNYYECTSYTTTYPNYGDGIVNFLKNYCKLATEDFEPTVPPTYSSDGTEVKKVTADGLDKIRENHKIGANFKGNVFDYLEIYWGPPGNPTNYQLIDENGNIPSDLFNDENVDIGFSYYNPFAINYFPLYRLAKLQYPDVLKNLSSSDMLSILQNVFNEDGTTKAHFESPDKDFSISFNTDFTDKYKDVLVDAGILVAADPSFRFTDAAIAKIKNNTPDDVTWLREAIQAQDPTLLFAAGTDNVDTYWMPLFNQFRTAALLAIDFTGASSSIIGSNVAAFVKNKFTIANPDYDEENPISGIPKTIEVSLMDASADVKKAIAEYQAIYENSIKKDYENISTFLIQFNQRMSKLDMGATAYSGDNASLLSGLNSTLPSIDRSVSTYTNDIDFPAAQAAFHAAFKSPNNVKQTITSTDLGVVSGVTGSDIYNALEQNAYIRNNKPVKMLTLKEFPPIYTSSGSFVNLTDAQKTDILSVFQSKYLGPTLLGIYNGASNLTLTSANAGNLSINIKDQLIKLISDDEFLNTIEYLQWVFDPARSVAIDNLATLGNYFADISAMTYSRGDLTKSFISTSPGSHSYSLSDLADSNSVLRGDNNALANLVKTKWNLNQFNFSSNQVAAYDFTKIAGISDSQSREIREGLKNQGLLDNDYSLKLDKDWANAKTNNDIRNAITDILSSLSISNVAVNDIIDALPLPVPSAEYTAMMKSFANYSSQFHMRSFNVPTAPGELINYNQYLSYLAINNTEVNNRLSADIGLLKTNVFDEIANNFMAWTPSNNEDCAATVNIGNLGKNMDLANVFEGYSMTTTYRSTHDYLVGPDENDETEDHKKTWDRTYTLSFKTDLDGNMVPMLDFHEVYTHTMDGINQSDSYNHNFMDKDPTTYGCTALNTGDGISFTDPSGKQFLIKWSGTDGDIDVNVVKNSVNLMPVAEEDASDWIGNMAISFNVDKALPALSNNLSFMSKWASGELLADATSTAVDKSIIDARYYLNPAPVKLALTAATTQSSFYTYIRGVSNLNDGYEHYTAEEVDDGTADLDLATKPNSYFNIIINESNITAISNWLDVNLSAEKDAIIALLQAARQGTDIEFKYYSNGKRDTDNDGTPDTMDPMRSLQDEFLRDFAGLRFDDTLDQNYISQAKAMEDSLTEMGLGPKLQGVISFNQDIFNHITVGIDDGPTVLYPSAEVLTIPELTYLQENGFIDKYGWCLKNIDKADDVFFPSTYTPARQAQITEILKDKSKWYVTEQSNAEHIHGVNYTTYNNVDVILHSRRVINDTEKATLLGYYDEANQNGIKTLCTKQVPSMYDLTMYVKQQFDRINSPLETKYEKYNDSRSAIAKLLSLGNDGTATSLNSISDAFKKQYLDEFYMKDDFSNLILGNEFNSRFNYASQQLGNTSGSVLAQGNQNSWYETNGRYTPKDAMNAYLNKNQENPTSRYMDFENMNYSIETDYNTQIDRVTSSSTTAEIYKLSKKDKRASRQKKVEDFYGRVSVFNNTVSSTLPTNAFGSEFKELIYKGDFMNIDEVQYDDSSGHAVERSEQEKMALVNELIEYLISMGYLTTSIDSSFTDDWIETAGAYKVESSDGADDPIYFYDDFSTFDFSTPPASLSNNKTKYQVFQLLKSSLTYAGRVGATMGFVHSGLEMNYFSMEESWARLMIMNWNDLQKDNYQKQSDQYAEDKKKYEDDQYSQQVAEAKAQERKAYLSSLRKK